MPSANPFDCVSNYWVDAWQCSILALDVLRRVKSLFGGISLATQTQESARA